MLLVRTFFLFLIVYLWFWTVYSQQLNNKNLELYKVNLEQLLVTFYSISFLYLFHPGQFIHFGCTAWISHPTKWNWTSWWSLGVCYHQILRGVSYISYLDQEIYCRDIAETHGSHTHWARPGWVAGGSSGSSWGFSSSKEAGAEVRMSHQYQLVATVREQMAQSLQRNEKNRL